MARDSNGPVRVARTLASTGRAISVEKLGRTGLFFGVVPADELVGTARDIASCIAAELLDAVRSAQRCMRAGAFLKEPHG